MFREAIAKKCGNQDCVLGGAPQDAHLPICPECAGELTPVTRLRYRLVAVTAVLLLAALGAGAAFTYGMAVRRLDAGQTVCWMTGRCTVAEGLAVPAQRKEWLRGSIQWNFAAGRPPRGFSDSLLCRERSGAQWCRPSFRAANGDRLQFELYPQAENLYVLHRSDSNSRRLYPDAGAPQGEPSPIVVPRSAEVELAGPGTVETFLIIVSKQPQPEIAALPEAGTLAAGIDAVVAPLSGQRDCLVLYVEIPH